MKNVTYFSFQLSWAPRKSIDVVCTYQFCGCLWIWMKMFNLIGKSTSVLFF
jgi:hypothetical protein